MSDDSPRSGGAFFLQGFACSASMAAMKMQVRIPREALMLTAAAIGGTGIFLLILSTFHGFQLAFYGLLLVGCATVIVRSPSRRG